MHFICDLHGDPEVVRKPFVELLLEEARAQDDEERDDGDEHTGDVVCLLRLLALVDLLALIDAPEHFHVLKLLPLCLIVLVIGRHLIDQGEVQGVAHANHDLHQRSNGSVDGAPTVGRGVRREQYQDDQHHDHAGHADRGQGIDNESEKDDRDWQQKLEEESKVNLGVVPASPLLLVASDLLIHLDFLLGHHLLFLVCFEREHVLRMLTRLILAHVAPILTLVVV